jgi:hypothetical protein
LQIQGVLRSVGLGENSIRALVTRPTRHRRILTSPRSICWSETAQSLKGRDQGLHALNVQTLASMTSPETIPEDVRQVFWDAIRLFANWTPAPDAPAPTIRFRSLIVSLSGVCDLVLGYKDEPLPLNVHDELWRLIDDRHTGLKAALATDPSYATGARCLDTLIQARRATASISRALVVEDNPELDT